MDRSEFVLSHTAFTSASVERSETIDWALGELTFWEKGQFKQISSWTSSGSPFGSNFRTLEYHSILMTEEEAIKPILSDRYKSASAMRPLLSQR